MNLKILKIIFNIIYYIFLPKIFSIYIEYFIIVYSWFDNFNDRILLFIPFIIFCFLFAIVIPA